MKELINRIKAQSEWYKYLKQYEKVMIFGAKENAYKTYLLVRRVNIDVNCFVVTKRNGNPSCFNGKPVKTLDEISEEDKSKALIIISLIYENNDTIKKELLCKGFKNIIPSATQIACVLTDDLRKYCDSLLGKMQMVRELCDCRKNKNVEKICIYAVTSHGNMHKSVKNYESKYIRYIFAGKANYEGQVEYNLGDNTGDNISALNPYFCELTAGYWIYKNDKINDYIGLYHYSRGLDITEEQINSIINTNIDVVLPVPYIYRYGTVIHFADGFIDVLEAINRICPDYLESAELYFTEKMFFCGNILLSKKNVFCRYYEWMFKILNECEKIRKREKKEISPRIWGYYGEHLTNIFFLKHIWEYNIAYAELKFMC